MLTGSTGLLILFIYRKKYEKAVSLSFKQLLPIFIALFWLREVANTIIWYWDYLLHGAFSTRGDEVRLALKLNLPIWIFSIISSIIGSAVLVIVLIKFIPQDKRFTFMLGGLFGGILGYFIWLEWFGKYIMP